MPVTLVLGGARSGKSSFAEGFVMSARQASSTNIIHYIATAEAFDEEMKARIEHHQKRRNNLWVEHEVPLHLQQILSSFNENDIVLVDCLTVWLNNVIYIERASITDDALSLRVDQLVDCLRETKANIVLVSNEVGMGIVPLGKETRLFVDYAGWMNQKIAAIAQRVILVTAGIPLALKGTID